MGISGITPGLSTGGASPAGNGSGGEQIRSLEKKLKDLQDEKKKAVLAKDMKKAQKLEKKIQEVKEQIEELKRRQKKDEGEETPEERAVKTPGTGDMVDAYA